MTYKLGVLVVHGMGSQDAKFADPLIKEVSKWLKGHAEAVCWRPVWWAHVLQDAEATLLRDLSQGNDLDFMKLRRFVIDSLGDAVAYQRVPDGAYRRNIYEEIHQVVAREMHALRAQMRQGVPAETPEAPLVIIAHSLGGHIMSNHIWDLQKGNAQPVDNNPFEKAETLAGIVTFGCNIPLFTLAYNKLEPIQFPAPGLANFFPPNTPPAKLRSAARWLNLYDPDDILGYPLRPLSQPYAATVTEDRAVNVGGIASAWNPLSHSAYWTDNDVTKPIAAQLEGLLDLLQ